MGAAEPTVSELGCGDHGPLDGCFVDLIRENEAHAICYSAGPMDPLCTCGDLR